MGVSCGSSNAGSSSSALANFNPQGGTVRSFLANFCAQWLRPTQVSTYEQQRAAESLYRDANTLLYADNKPSEDAIDRVIGKLNIEYVRLRCLCLGI